MPSFCAQCGSALKPYAKFCEECGMRTSPLPVGERSFPWRVVLVATVSFVLGLIAFVFFARNSGGREAASRASYEVEALRAKNVEYEANLRKVMDENQRLSGLIERERQTAEALGMCQSNLQKVNQDRDLIMRSRQALELEVAKLKAKVAAATPSVP